LNLETTVGSQKSAQALGAPGKIQELGRWLLGARSDFLQDQEPDYEHSPIDRRMLKYAKLGPQLVSLAHKKQGRICVIGPKARPLAAGIETTLVKNRFHILESNELSNLRKLIIQLANGSADRMANAALSFLARAYGGQSSDDKAFVKKILTGASQRPVRADRKLLCANHSTGTNPELVYDLIEYLDQIEGTSCKLSESVSALKCIVEEQRESGEDLRTLYAEQIGKRKYQSRSNVYRCVGSTLLVKGLEFDHVVVLRGSDWQKSWGNHKDLYVALTRGTKTTTLMELTN